MKPRSTLVLISLYTVSVATLLAGVVEGPRAGNLNFNVSASSGPLSDEASFLAIDEAEPLYADTILLEAESGDDGVSAEVRIEMTSTGNFIEQVSGLTGLSYYILLGHLLTEVTASGAGIYEMEEDFSGTFQSLSPGNEAWNEFTVTGGPEVASITVAMETRAPGGSLSKLSLQRRDGSAWQDVAVYHPTTLYAFEKDTLLLDPGDYRIFCEAPTSGTFDTNIGPLEIYEGISYEITFGHPPVSVPLPEEGDYTYPFIGTDFVDPVKLTPLNPLILSETDLGDGTTELTFTVNLVNTSLCPWHAVRVRLREAEAGEAAVLEADEGVAFDLIEGLSTVGALYPSVVVVTNEHLTTVRASILDGSRLTTSGRELIVFRYPVTAVGPLALDYQRDDSSSLEFYLGAPAGPGDILIEWEPYFAVPPRLVPDGVGGERWVQNFDKELPLFVQSVTLNQGTIQDPRSYISMSGKPMSLLELVKHGTIRHKVENPFPQYTRNATEGSKIEEQEHFPFPWPLHVNQISLDDVVEVSGNFNFIPGSFDVDYEMEDGGLNYFIVRKSYTAELNVLVETTNHEEVGGSPLVDEEKTLLLAPLFSLQLPGGFVMTESLQVDIGVLADVTRSLSIPFVSRYTVTVEAGMKDGEPYYDYHTNLVPLAVSDPGIFDAIGADLDVWLKTELRTSLVFPAGASATVTTGTRAEGSFGLHPLANPWWDTSAELALTAGFEFALAPFLKLVDLEHDLATYPLFAHDAGGSLINAVAASSLPPEGLNPGIAPIADPTARWSRGILASDSISGLTDILLIPLANSTDYLAGQYSVSANRLYKVSADGTVRGGLSTSSPLFSLCDAVPTEDGGALILGNKKGKVQWIRVDEDLQLVSQHAFTTGGLTYESLRIASTPTHLFVLGKEYLGSPFREQTVLSCFTLDGTLVWSRSYQLDPLQHLYAGDFLIASDGDLVLCGVTTADFETEDGLADGYLLPNITNNGLLAKVDAETGNVLWANMIPHRYTPHYNALAESPTGELTIGGRQGVIYPKADASLMLLQFTAEGQLLEGILIGHSGSDKAAPNPEAAHLLSDLPHGGETYYDEILDLEWTEEGLWACGRMGIYNVGSVLNTGSAGISLFFDPNLNPSRYVVHGGLSEDRLERLIMTESGPLLAGTSRSFHPWPTGAMSEADSTPHALWLLKLPWEGRLRFHETSSGAQPSPDAGPPAAGSFYIYPRVVSGLLSGTLDLNQPSRDTYGQGDDLITGASRTLTTAEFELSASTLEVTLTPSPVEEVKALEFLPRELITDRDSFLAWHQMDAEEDADGDQLDTGAEFFLGTDPAMSDFNVIDFEVGLDEITDEPVARYTLTRGKLAAPALPEVYSTGNLQSEFDLRPDVDASVKPHDSQRDLLILELPAPDLMQFYHLTFP